jgi:hypothetical protein
MKKMRRSFLKDEFEPVEQRPNPEILDPTDSN